MQLASMSWQECQEYLRRDDRVILPMGATEQHGRHLGLGCDYMLADAIARRVGERTGVAVAPALAYGMSHMHMEFAGTLSVSPDALAALLLDLFRSSYLHGFHRWLIVNGHGGNQPALQSAATALYQEAAEVRVKVFQWWTEPEVVRIVDEALGAQRGTHASNHETSFLLAVRPDAVKMGLVARRDAPVQPTSELDSPARFAAKYPDGVMGLDPSQASAELGQLLWNKSVELCVNLVEYW